MTQRSPVIFWLLLAATISVDAIALSWMASEPFPVPVFVTAACHALILSQLSVVCIWSSLSLKKSAWTRFVPGVGAVVATLVIAMSTNEPVIFQAAFTTYLSYFGLHAALLVAALWLFERTAFWRRRSGIPRDWQYSLAHLLIVMTVVAILAVALRSSPYFGDDRWINIVFVCSSVALAVASVFLWSLTWHWLLRLAAVLGFAWWLGAVFIWTNNQGLHLSTILSTHYLLQAIVLCVWLGCGPVLPNRITSAAAGR